MNASEQLVTSRATSNGLQASLDDFFHAPAGRVSDFWRMQLHLYKQDVRLQDYFSTLQMDLTGGSATGGRPQRTSSLLFDRIVRGADKVKRFSPRQTIKADVLFCPTPNVLRKTENDLFVRTLIGLAQTDATIICLLQATAACKPELERQLLAIGRRRQVTFVDPLAPLAAMESRFRSQCARVRARETFEVTRQILAPYGLAPGSGVVDQFNNVALFVEAWERLASSIEFEAAFVRCHWHTLCSAVCRTGIERGKRVITFQQGVIGHSLDTPVTASSLVAFGPSSASFLSHLNRAFFEAAGRPEPRTQYINGGCLYDNVVPLPDQFDHQTVLMVDVPQPLDQEQFYGVRPHCQALLQLADDLLVKRPSLRLIIRPHPYWGNLDLEACQRLAREFPWRCELSHPAWSLEDDLRRSSVAIGIFSGALTVASACGLPAIFLETEGGYTTGDLACFADGQSLLPNAAFERTSEILDSREAYAAAKNEALRNAREYYAQGSNLELNGALFDYLLRS